MFLKYSSSIRLATWWLISVQRLISCLCFTFAVFYIRFFDGKLSIPLSWFPTKTFPAYLLASINWEAVIVSENAGIRVLEVVADEAATNRKFFEIIHGFKFNLTEKFTSQNLCDVEQVVYLCSNSSHLLKVRRC